MGSTDWPLATKRRCRSCGTVYGAYDAHPCLGGSDPYTEPDPSARMLRALTEQTEALRRLPSMLTPAPSYDAGLSDADVRRIAEAVADEMEWREASPLRVTAADVRRYLGGRHGS